MTTTPETNTKTDSPHHFLAGLAQQGRYAYDFARTGHMTEALEHMEAIERLLAAYRAATGASMPETGQVVGIELLVQIQDDAGLWRGWRSPIPGLFVEEGRRLLAQARAGWPHREFRLVRRTTSVRDEEIVEAAAVDGVA